MPSKLKSLRYFLCLSMGAGLAAGCSRVESPEPQIVRLEPAEAARLAELAREEVSVELYEGLDLKLWASEALLGDPVALHVDEWGRVYVTRTTRHRRAEFDIRDRPEWMIPSVTLQSVEDRRAFLRRELAPERSEENLWLPDWNEDGLHDWRDLKSLKEIVYRIEDTEGDGLADFSQVFYEGFNEEVSDIAAGVFSRGDDVYVTVAPDLWRLRDTVGDGWADSRESLIHGFGVHIGFSAHGLSGPTVGPDGRLYWSIGDIGAHVVDREGRRWVYPNQGIVVRSNFDGSDFEVFAAGLRNTHEFVFDEYGNLLSVDNDGDHPGEYERLVYITEGSDSGWRINWQFGKYTDPDNNDYKVWMDEGLYKPRFEGQAAYITPPVAAYHAGPSGLAYSPGGALSQEWRNFVFVSSFTGTPSRSRVTAFRLEERGAGFELVEDREVLSGLQITSLAFGPNGSLYLSDWIEGWGLNEAGRIWRLDSPDAASSPLRAETRSLLQRDFSGKNSTDLPALLEHADMRVRLKAQFELVERSAEGREAFLSAQRGRSRAARIHGIWGLGQLARSGLDVGEPLIRLLGDGDAEIRAQAAKVLGDMRHAPAAAALIPLLGDESARPRFFAAQALGRIGHVAAVGPILDMLEADDEEDVFLRHAGTLSLARIGEAEPILALANHPSRALRIAAVVTLRRMQHPGVARFLKDTDEFIVTEAARAINDDFSIERALPELAGVLEQERFTSEALLRRAINANLRVGSSEAAQRVAAFASTGKAPAEIRAEAVSTVGVWPRPSILDRVDGRYRGAVERDPSLAREAVSPVLEDLLGDEAPLVRAAAAETAGRLQIGAAGGTLSAMARSDPSPEVRRVALNALFRMDHERLGEAVRVALEDDEDSVRMVALRLIPDIGLPDETAAALLASVLEKGSIPERQSALEALGDLRSVGAHRVLGGLLSRLEANELAQEIRLDLMEAVEASGAPELIRRLDAYRDSRPVEDPVAFFGETLKGGNAAAGRRLFVQHPVAQCIRCHASGTSAEQVGPDLSTVGAGSTREELLQALVDPSARITPGFGMVILTLESGETVGGILSEETDDHLFVEAGGGERHKVSKSEIKERRDAPSSMPPMGPILTRREIRDLVEYLTTLR